MAQSNNKDDHPQARDRRSFLKLSTIGTLLLGTGLAGCGKKTGLPAWSNGQRPIVINGLGQLGNPNLRIQTSRKRDKKAALSWKHNDTRALREAHESGLTAANITMGYVGGPGDPYAKTVREVTMWDRWIRKNPDDLMKILTGADILEAHVKNKIGVIFGFQNGVMVGDDATRVAKFAEHGIRIMQLTYNQRNQLGDGALEAKNAGLTNLGRDVVAALNENRVLVDLSHSGEQLCLDAVPASNVPVAITHTGCRALADHPRNKTDQEMRLVADNGGVIGIYHMPYLTPGRQSRVEDYLRHIDHAFHVCGEDHIGMGTDTSVTTVDNIAAYKKVVRRQVQTRDRQGIGAPGELSGVLPMLPDLRGPEQFSRLADLMADRGHGAERIEKFLGRNFLRLMTEVWPLGQS